MNNTRTIAYIDSEEDTLDEMVALALQSSAEENLLRFCEVLSAQLSMQDIDLKHHPVKRTIYYIEP